MYRDTGPPNWKCIYIRFQCRDAFIIVQKGPQRNRQTEINSQKARRRPDGLMNGRIYYTDTQGICSQGLRLHDLSAVTSCLMNLYFRLKSIFKKKSNIIYIYKKNLFFGVLLKNPILKIIASFNLNSRGRTNDHQKLMQMK